MTDFKQDTDETPVLFRVWKSGDKSIMALFPTIQGTYAAHTCSSYAVVGQHGSADLQYVINKTRAAQPAEYADLKAELEGPPFGYRLKVYAHNQRSFTKDRERQLREIK